MYCIYIYIYKHKVKTNTMKKAIILLNKTITEIENQIVNASDNDKLTYLQRAKKEAIICLTTLKYINQ